MNEWDLLAKKLQAQRSQNALAEAQNNANQNQGGGGFWDGIGSVLSGIGNSIGNVGKTLGDIATRGAIGLYAGTGLKSALEGKDYMSALREGQRDTDDFVKRYWESNDIKDARTKAGGAGLNAAATVSDLIPGLGKGAKVALNVGQGVVSGVGNELAQNGSNATLENALKGAVIGGAGAGVGQLVGGKLAKSATAPAKGLIGKAVQSGIGRGAITGAASGAVGSGLNTILNHGDFGQTLSSALQGAGQGSLAGATTAAIYGAAGNALGKVKDRIENGPKAIQNDVSNVLADQPEEDIPEATKRRQTALGWDGEKVDASKRNAIQKLGKAVENMGKSTENSKLLGKLNNNTARDVEKNDTLNVLKKKYGYTVGDYDKAADLSSATNAWIKNEAASSGASGYDTKLTDKISLNNYKGGDLLVDISDKGAKQFRRTTQQLLDSARVQGGGVDEYSASALYDAADEASNKAHQFYENSHSKMDGSILAGDKAAEKAALSQAYSNFAKEARATANNMLGGEIDDITRSNLTKMLKSSGAPEAAIKTLSQAKTLSELKTLTSPLETARDITTQISQTDMKRGATTSSSINPLTKLANAVGVSQAIDELAAPAGQVVGKVEQGVGKAITGIGNALSGEGTGVTNKAIKGVGNAVKGINSGLAVGDADYGFSSGAKLANKIGLGGQSPLTVGDLANKQIARQTALGLAQDQDKARASAQAQEALYNAQTDFDNASAAYQTALNNQAAANQQGTQTLSRIENAMQLALNAGDFTSYSKLADLYKQASSIYGSTTTSASNAKALSSNQAKALTAQQQLEQLAQMSPDFGTALSDMPILGQIIGLSGGNEYANQAKALATTLGYLLSGANIKEEEAQRIGQSYVPNAYDSDAVRQQKIARAKQLIQSYLSNTSSIY